MDVGKLELQPIIYAEACAFIYHPHRHHLPPHGWKFGIGLNDGSDLVGVITIGRPVARHLDDGWTLEVTRSCTNGTRNANSKLYAAAWRAARAMGYKRLITYTLIAEPGTSLKAAGWKIVHATKGNRNWDTPSRPRTNDNKYPENQKLLWEAA